MKHDSTRSKKTIDALIVTTALCMGLMVSVKAQIPSQNALGHIKIDLVPGKYHNISIPFVTPIGQLPYTPSKYFDPTFNLPIGTTIVYWNNETQIFETGSSLFPFGWSPDTSDISSSNFWFYVPNNASSATALYLHGEVPSQLTLPTTSYFIQEPLGGNPRSSNWIAYLYPVTKLWINTQLSDASGIGDTVIQYDPLLSYYGSASLFPFGWSPTDLELKPGHAYFFSHANQNTIQWNENIPYLWPNTTVQGQVTLAKLIVQPNGQATITVDVPSGFTGDVRIFKKPDSFDDLNYGSLQEVHNFTSVTGPTTLTLSDTVTTDISFYFAVDSSVDTDADGLTDLDELDLGTDPYDDDTDKDGITDGDEVLGTTSGINLPAMGANPLRKNIFLEMDWFNGISGTGFASGKPSASFFTQIEDAFFNAPISNPDGSTGVDFAVDVGQGGLYTGGNQITYTPSSFPVNNSDIDTYKMANFDQNRMGIFHYGIFVREINDVFGASVRGLTLGDDIFIECLTTFLNNSPNYIPTIVMHELGHTLGLDHGGAEIIDGNVSSHATSRKPNYNSVMSFFWSDQGGVDADCDGIGDQLIDFSRGNNIPIYLTAIDESAGYCGNTPVDIWPNSVVDPIYSISTVTDLITKAPGFFASGIDPSYADNDDLVIFNKTYAVPMTDFDDWGYIETNNKFQGIRSHTPDPWNN